MAKVGRMKLGSQGLEVSLQALGCMGMSAFYGPPKPDSDMIALIHHAVESGVTFLDTSDVYGPHTNEVLIGKVPTLICYPFIRAHAVHPITAVQLEWSLWSRDVEEDIVPTCRELGIGIVAYSPLGRGFLSSGTKVLENLTQDDFRQILGKLPYYLSHCPHHQYLIIMSCMLLNSLQSLPRFQPENLEHNKTIFERVNEMARKKRCTPSQLALAWVHHQGNDVCPIPGTTKIENFNQNIGALSVKLTPEEIEELESFAAADDVKGDRYASDLTTWRESDTPPLSSWKFE
ncbi:hypothetical protein RIF29_10072 [Crotalaria pallida]|uniref:NADP-dependent oxidoreductase domain-containing protein n=1 Tax=Crotalaria pallida TaxID=3830 RepID=A0AAN9FSJ0_CROPI